MPDNLLTTDLPPFPPLAIMDDLGRPALLVVPQEAGVFLSADIVLSGERARDVALHLIGASGALDGRS